MTFQSPWWLVALLAVVALTGLYVLLQLRRAGAGHLQLRTDRDWLMDVVRFVADRRRAGSGGASR